MRGPAAGTVPSRLWPCQLMRSHLQSGGEVPAARPRFVAPRFDIPNTGRKDTGQLCPLPNAECGKVAPTPQPLPGDLLSIHISPYLCWLL